MPKEKSLIVAYLLDGKGGGKRIDWDEINTWTPNDGLLWVHLNYSYQRSIQWLKNKSGLDVLTVKAMSLDETRPRALFKQNGLLVSLRGVNLNPEQDPEDMVSLRIWISENCIISTRKRRILSINDIREAIDSGNGPKSPSEFLRMANHYLLNRMSTLVESVYDQVDELEEAVISSESRLLRPRIADIRRQSISIRRYLAPQREALKKLCYESTPFLTIADKSQLHEDSDRLMRFIENLDAARDRASVTQEELASRLSEQIDKRMYLLSLVAIIFLPLSFVTGLLGINVGGIPGSENPWAFLIVCLILSGGLFLMFWYLIIKKWI